MGLDTTNLLLFLVFNGCGTLQKRFCSNPTIHPEIPRNLGVLRGILYMQNLIKRWQDGEYMSLIEKLKNETDKANDKEKAMERITEAGMDLTDDELDQVSGGSGDFYESEGAGVF